MQVPVVVRTSQGQRVGIEYNAGPRGRSAVRVRDPQYSFAAGRELELRAVPQYAAPFEDDPIPAEGENARDRGEPLRSQCVESHAIRRRQSETNADEDSGSDDRRAG